MSHQWARRPTLRRSGLGRLLAGVLLAALASASALAQVNAQRTTAVDQAKSAHSDPAMAPELAHLYHAMEPTASSFRVVFEQDGGHLEATWIRGANDVYSRGTYSWDASRAAFVGKTITRETCGIDTEQHGAPIEVVIREEISVVDQQTIRDRWTKPLRIDCTAGVSDVYKWVETRWSVTPSSRH